MLYTVIKMERGMNDEWNVEDEHDEMNIRAVL